MQGSEESGVDRVLSVGEKAKRMWELGAFLITAGTAIAAFVRNVGGPVQFLVEVGFIGFAAYAALFIVVIPVFFLLSGAEKLTHRESTDTAYVVAGSAAAILGAVAIRFGLFAPGVTEDLDTVGTVFAAAVGVCVLLSPFAVLWYVRGSRPAAGS